MFYVGGRGSVARDRACGVSRARGSATCVQGNVRRPPGVARLIGTATPHGPLFRLHATQPGLVRRVSARVRTEFWWRARLTGLMN